MAISDNIGLYYKKASNVHQYKPEYGKGYKKPTNTLKYEMLTKVRKFLVVLLFLSAFLILISSAVAIDSGLYSDY
ncbi:MAG: hypothetical protein ACE5J9_05980, partial [Methanosarcinales archaeon]